MLKMEKVVNTGLIMMFLFLAVIFPAFTADASVDLDHTMVYNVFEEDSVWYVLKQIALDTQVMIRIDPGIIERDITVDWSKGVTLRQALDYACGIDNVWGVEDNIIIVAPVEPTNANFQKLCGDPVEFTLHYVDSVQKAVTLMDDYYARFCRADEERNRVIIHAPLKIRKEIIGYLESIDSPREKVVLKSNVVFIRTSSLGSIGFKSASTEWGGGVETKDRQFLEFVTGIGGVYESDKAGKLQLAIDMLVERGIAVRKANPCVVGEVGALIEAKFGEKIWVSTYPPREEEGVTYYYYELEEIEAPVSLKAIPIVKGNLITLKNLEVTCATLSRVGGFPVVSEQIARSRITVESGQTIIVGGLSQQTKKSLLKQILPGKEWEEEEVEVLIFITPTIWTEELAQRETFLEKILEKIPEKKEKFKSYLSIGGCYLATQSLDEYLKEQGYDEIYGVVVGQLRLNLTPHIGLFIGGGRGNADDGCSLQIANIGLVIREENKLFYASIAPGYATYRMELGGETYDLASFMAQAELAIRMKAVKVFGGYRYVDKKWRELEGVNMSDYVAGIEIDLR